MNSSFFLQIVRSLVIISVVSNFLSCIGDDSFDNSPYIRNTSNSIISKIKKLALEYNVIVDVEGFIPSSEENKIDFAEIENLFSAMSALRGSYRFCLNEKLGNNSYVQKTKRVISAKTRSLLYEGYGGSEGFYICNFEDPQTGITEQIIERGAFVLACRCVAKCVVNPETRYAESLELQPLLSSNASGFSDGGTSLLNVEFRPTGDDGNMSFLADVNYKIERNFYDCDSRNGGQWEDIGDTKEYLRYLDDAEGSRLDITNYENYISSTHYNAYLGITFKLTISGVCKPAGGYIIWKFREL